MVRLLVTGGNGFIGRHVVAEARRRGHDVHTLKHDLTKPTGLAEMLRGVETIVHCAAAMTGDLDQQRAVTVEGTRNLLAAMQEAGVGHIVGISTLALYDYSRILEGDALDEDSALDADVDDRGPYVYAKRAQEDAIREQATARGWRWTVLRPGIVFGPGRTWFYHLGAHLSPGLWVSYAGASALPLVYVEHCAEAIVLSLERESANGQTLNIVDDDLPSRRRYLDALAVTMPVRPRIVDIPWLALKAGARVASAANRGLLSGKAPLPDILRPHSLHARCKPLRFPNARARRALGWSPRWTFDDALQRSLSTGS